MTCKCSQWGLIYTYQLNGTKENIMTLAQRFKHLAGDLMPHQSDLMELDSSIDSASEIDEIMFHKGEYIGGMAAVLLALLAKENAK